MAYSLTMKKRKADTAVFGMEPGPEITFRFREVEGNALRFGQSGDEEHEEPDRLVDDVPDIGLRPHDLEQAHRLRQHDHADDREPHRDLVADHLRAGPEAAQDRIFAVGGPAAEDDAVDLDPDHREDEEERHVHIGGVERDLGTEDRDGFAEGDRDEHHEGRGERQDRRQFEQEAVGLGRDVVLFGQELDAVRHGLQQPVPPHAHRPHPLLDVSADLAFQPGQRQGQQQQDRNQQRDLEDDQAKGDDEFHDRRLLAQRGRTRIRTLGSALSTCAAVGHAGLDVP